MRKRTVVSYVAYALALLLVIGVVAGVATFFSAHADSVKDVFAPEFRVECEDEVFRPDANNILRYPFPTEVRFDVRNGGNFHYALLPNVEDGDFSFSVLDVSHLFSEEQDLSPAFSITEFDSAIVIDFSKDYSVENVLTYLWGAKATVNTLPKSMPYKLVFQSDHGESITVYFDLGFTLNTSHVIF